MSEEKLPTATTDADSHYDATITWAELLKQGNSVLYAAEIANSEPTKTWMESMRATVRSMRTDTRTYCLYQVASNEDSIRFLYYPFRVFSNNFNGGGDDSYGMIARKAKDGTTAEFQRVTQPWEGSSLPQGPSTAFSQWKHMPYSGELASKWCNDDRTCAGLRRRAELVQAERIYLKLRDTIERIKRSVRKLMEEGEAERVEGGGYRVCFRLAIPRGEQDDVIRYYKLRYGQTFRCGYTDVLGRTDTVELTVCHD